MRLVQMQQLRVAQTGELQSIANGNTDIFRVRGPVKILDIVGVVTSAFQNSACNLKLVAQVGSLTAVDMCATVSVQNAAAGSSVRITGTLANAAVLTANGGITPSQASPVLVPAVTANGVIRQNASAGITGKIRWQVLYQPLAPGAKIEPMVA